jgi:WD40 repeat protein
MHLACCSHCKGVLWIPIGPAHKPCVALSLPAAVTSVAFAPASSTATDGSVTWHLAVGLEDGSVQLWRIAETGGEAAGLPPVAASCVWQASRFHVHAGAVRRLAWRRRNGAMQLATCSEDHAIKLFNIAL